MFDQLLDESVTEAESLTAAIARERDPQSLGAVVGAAITKAVRSLPVDAMLAALVVVWMVPEKSKAWWY